jgi:ADP-ribose pyrophosphatase
MKKWKTLESQTLYKNQWFDIKEERVQVSPDLAVEGVIVMKFPNWVNIIPLNLEERVILVHQYRHAIEDMTIETPSGSLEPQDASPRLGAERELLEETGCRAAHWIYLGQSQVNPQLMNNYLHHFLALACVPVEPPVIEIGGISEFWDEPFEHAFEKIRDGRLNHGMTVDGLFRARDWIQKNPEEYRRYYGQTNKTQVNKVNVKK